MNTPDWQRVRNQILTKSSNNTSKKLKKKKYSNKEAREHKTPFQKSESSSESIPRLVSQVKQGKLKIQIFGRRNMIISFYKKKGYIGYGFRTLSPESHTKFDIGSVWKHNIIASFSSTPRLSTSSFYEPMPFTCSIMLFAICSLLRDEYRISSGPNRFPNETLPSWIGIDLEDVREGGTTGVE